MYILKNALKNIRNSPVRNLLIGIIIMVISLICCMSLALLRISDKAEKEALMKASVTAKIIKGDITDSIDTSDNLTYDEVRRFAGSKYVQDSYISAQADVNVDVTADKCTLVGYNSEMATKHFFSVDKILISGNLFDLANSAKECIISRVLATSYDLKIGETISLQSEGQVHELEITGFYRGDEFNKNNIVTSLDVFESIVKIDDQTKIASTFVFNDPDSITPFRKYVSDSNEPGIEYRVFFSGVQKFRDYFSPIKSAKNFAVLSLILSLFVGGSVLIVISIFNIQERKYEVGVLSAIGMTKEKVVLQFILEVFMITLFSVIVGISFGAPLSVTAASSTLSPKMYTGLTHALRVDTGLQEEGSAGFNDIKIGYLPDANSDKDLVAIMGIGSTGIDKLKAVMDLGVVLKVIAIGMVLTIIASLGSIIFIVRFKPLDILNERN